MGTLYVVATPIGNLEDMTLRAVRVLREVKLIAAEDTRTTRKLLAHFDIHTPLTSYHEYTEPAKIERLLDRLAEGDMALVSEAGMPGISDPGAPLIQAAIQRGLPVVPVPGASAILAALAVSGLSTESFLYLGFLPRRASDRRARLAQVAQATYTLVLFESPHRLRDTLADLHAVLGERPVALARELTKLHEEVWRGTLAAAIAHYVEVEPRGEFTLVVGGATPVAAVWDEAAVRAALSEALAQGQHGREAARAVAAQAGWPSREVYEVLQEMMGRDGKA
ncbi:MAG: 16S rRNA (cytidine(1402)-2'-O)-methyltransferase [Anaerolineae bacterium]|nr:16S rRNA (cytidine(1402)-2'-O)-methyltransferase [Anaerolineae bacterium]